MNIKNYTQVIGRIGNDLEMKSFDNDTSFLNFTLAVDDSFFSKTEDKKIERVVWLNCVAKGKIAEHIFKYYAKGYQIAIQGKLSTRNYEDKEGKVIYITEIEVETADITLRVIPNKN